MTEQQQLEAAIAALEGQRSTLGRAAVESLLSAARARLEALEPLDAAPNAAAQTLRQVSILFMDVVGSTALSQQLDPEAISAVLDGALSRATVVVQAHGGKVLQYAGDNVLAAARMEQTAPAGALRISHDAHAQVRGLFEVERQAPIAVKGIDEPVQSYLVLRARPRSFHAGSRGIEGVSTRMIGRDAELEALQDAFKRLFIDRQLAAITVVADAGIGKSRLLREFSAWCDARAERFIRFRGRATPQTQGQPYGLLRDPIAWHFRIADDDSVEAARRKMEERIVPLFLDECGPDEAQAQAHLLGHLTASSGATAATSAASSTTRSRSATAPSMPPRSCSAASAAPSGQRSFLRSLWSAKTCTGPTTRAWTFSLTWPKSTATCRC